MLSPARTIHAGQYTPQLSWDVTDERCRTGGIELRLLEQELRADLNSPGRRVRAER